MRRLQPPRCAAPNEDRGGTCGVTMRPLGERHPSFGPNYRPGVWVFECPRCNAVRAIDADRPERYAGR